MSGTEHLQAPRPDPCTAPTASSHFESVGEKHQLSDPSVESTSVPWWSKYAPAAQYLGITVSYLRCLVSSDAIPVYGGPRSRRFRRDMLDLFITDREVAMRQFRREREALHVE